MSTTINDADAAVTAVEPVAPVVPSGANDQAIPEALAAVGFEWWMVRWSDFLTHIHAVGYRAAFRALDAVHERVAPFGAGKPAWDALCRLPSQAWSCEQADAPACFRMAHDLLACFLAREACMEVVRFPRTSHAQPREVRARAYSRSLCACAAGGAR